MLYFEGENSRICGLAESLITNQQGSTFAENPQIQKIIEARKKFADFRYAELICGPPTFAFQG